MKKMMLTLVVSLLILTSSGVNKSFAADSGAIIKLRLMTLNVAQLPLPTPGPLKRILTKLNFGLNMSSNKKRARRLIETFKKLEKKPDIVTFQELFDPDSADYISKEFEKMGYFQQFRDKAMGRKVLGMHSGLALFTKYKITKSAIVRYHAHRGVENFAKKSMLMVKVEITPGNSIYVMTSHLQAGVGSGFFNLFDKKEYLGLSSIKLRVLELEQARAYFDRIFKDDNSPLILAGDLNIDYNSEKDGYYDALKIMDVGPTYVSVKGAYQGTTWKVKHFNKTGKRETERDYPIDHIWVQDKEQRISKAVSKIGGYFGPDISDHLELWGIIKLNVRDGYEK